ncbi:putative ribosomal-protein-alanine acetyltransferase [Gossypium australe]|uniref:Putative ribosomal-protein-alanine acetyltransferase n=1 Tax=Gossypium australe TaxID=47621 RepID=A0A5B6X509_9ROSI|nr:putative ribosomal-protein-alanine acetyltransferase [Gossypium australe]
MVVVVGETGVSKKEEARDCVVSKGVEITGLPFERKSCYFFLSTPGTTLLHYHAHVVDLSLVGNVFRRVNQYMKASLNRTG